MKWGALFGISIIIITIVFFQFPKMKEYQKKDKIAFISLSVLGWLLATLLVFYPQMPGPTQLIDWLFKPLGNLIK